MKFGRSSSPDNSLAEISKNDGFLSKLLGGAEYCHATNFKKKKLNGEWEDVPIWMRLLTVRENMEIEDELNKEFGDEVSAAAAVRRAMTAMKLTLEKACTVKEKKQELVASALSDIPDTHLYQLNLLYTELCAMYDPSIEAAYDQGLIKALVEDLEKKSRSLTELSRYELVMAIKFLMSERIELMDSIHTWSSQESMPQS